MNGHKPLDAADDGDEGQINQQRNCLKMHTNGLGVVWSGAAVVNGEAGEDECNAGCDYQQRQKYSIDKLKLLFAFHSFSMHRWCALSQ